MKKFIIALTAALCLAFTLPAAAQVQISGFFSFDVYSNYLDEELESGGVLQGNLPTTSDRRETQMNVYTYLNYLRFSWANKDNTIGATTQIYGGRRNDTSPWTVDFGNNHIWWKPMPTVILKFGYDSQVVGGLAPPGILGSLDVTIVSITAGNLHTSYKPQIKAEIKINDMVGLELAVVDPDDDGTPALAGLPGAVAGTTANEEISIPRFDIGLPIKFGNISFKPKASWSRRTFDDVAANTDDDYDIWVLSIDGRLTWGPLTLSGEYSTGENIGDGNLTGGTVPNAQWYTNAAGRNVIVDSEQDLWWANINWKISPTMNVDVFYGEYQGENDDDPTVAADNWDIERKSYGIRFNYNIASNFIVAPSYIKWDYGDSNRRPGSTLTLDEGEESVVGATFMLIF